MKIKSLAVYPHVVVIPELEKVMSNGEILEVSDEIGNELISRLSPVVVEVLEEKAEVKAEEPVEEAKTSKKKRGFENAANKELPEEGMFSKEFN